MSQIRRVAPLAALVALAAFAASSLAATSHAKFWQNKSKSVACGVKIHAPKKAATLVICSSKGIPKGKKGIGDPFVQIGKRGKAQLILQSQSPFEGSTPTTLSKGSTWSSLGVSCTVAAKTVTCMNSSNHGFTIGNGKYKSF